MKSSIVKRSIVLAGHKTSISLEDALLTRPERYRQTRRTTLSDLVGSIDLARTRQSPVGFAVVRPQSLPETRRVRLGC